MQGINRTVIFGNLTRDPHLKTTAGGNTVCELAIAVNSREKVGEEWQDRADFFDVVVWGDQADACAQYLGKGRPVAVEGRLRQERWETAEGKKRSRVTIIASSVQFLPSKHGGGDRPVSDFEPPVAARTAEADFSSDADSDIPF